MTPLAPLLTLAFLSAAPVASSPNQARAPEVGVPFGCGLSFPVSQAHATGSHFFNDIWAWDFRMPEGTPIVAAKDGVVRLARGDSTVGGCDPEWAAFANYVVVMHEDGLETQYLHFHDVSVKAGDRVRAGDLLGHSGQTGWACGAHLHFKVAQATGRGWNNPSVPARIVGYGDPSLETQILAPACVGPRQPQPLVAEKDPVRVQTPLLDRVSIQQQDSAQGASAPLPAPRPTPIAGASPESVGTSSVPHASLPRAVSPLAASLTPP